VKIAFSEISWLGRKISITEPVQSSEGLNTATKSEPTTASGLKHILLAVRKTL